MAYLIDTNILIRLAKHNDPERPIALKALQTLKGHNEDLCYTTQVVVEFLECMYPTAGGARRA
jgi:predicted nucleic acid-binding protein